MPRGKGGAFRQGIATGIGSAVGTVLVLLVLAALFGKRENAGTQAYASEYAAMATPGGCS